MIAISAKAKAMSGFDAGRYFDGDFMDNGLFARPFAGGARMLDDGAAPFAAGACGLYTEESLLNDDLSAPAALRTRSRSRACLCTTAIARGATA
jgi:hypothetical protein